MEIHQSDLASWARCPQQVKLTRDAQAAGKRIETLSATVFGTVIHHAAQIMETLHHDGRADTLDVALATWEHYWHPDNIDALEPGGIDVWLPRQTWAGLRIRGRDNLRRYHDVLIRDNGKLLGLEIPFRIPVTINGQPHTIAGTIDRLALRLKDRRPHLSVEDFKGLALHTSLPTPTGWTTMGAVQVGDHLLGADGRVCKVTAKSRVHQRPCYRIRFDDGTSIIADHMHQWYVQTDHGPSLLSTTQLRAQLINPTTGQRHLRILNARPLQLPPADLPIDPYALGVWLGDGKHTSGEISKPDDELFQRLANHGYPSNGTGASRTALGLSKQLRRAGLLGHKHIPPIYLRASIDQRLGLLRGLMDTDGSWHRRRHRAIFTNCNKDLAEGVRELACSLGWRPTMFEVTRRGFGRQVTVYDVTFVPLDANCFALSRKAALVDIPQRGLRARRRLIRSVEPIPIVPTQCITVDSPDLLYLAGDQMIPTHNSGAKPTYLRHALQWTLYSWASLQPAFWTVWDQDLDALTGPLADRGLALYADGSGLPVIPRRGRWIALRDAFGVHDAGWRTPTDYARMHVALAEYVRSNTAQIFPLSISGAICTYCPFAYDGSCGGIPLSTNQDGQPYPQEAL